MDTRKKRFFLFATLLIPIAVLILSIVILIVMMSFKVGKSDYEKELDIVGYSAADLRARAPYVMFRPAPGNPAPGQEGVNSLGFNSPEISIEKKHNEYRIAIVGGSVAFNGKRRHSTVAKLARILKENVPELRFKDVTYINGGIPSAVTGQELAQFIHYILPLDIDLLVVYDGYNDFFMPFNYDRRPGYPFDYIIEEYRYNKFASDRNWWDTLSLLFDPALMKRSEKAVAKNYYTELGIDIPTFEEAIGQTYESYFRNITTMATIANAFGIKAAVFLQPYSPKHNDGKTSNTDIVVKLYTMADEKFKELAKENSPDKIFCSFVYMGFRMKDLFTDIAHMPREANEMIANEMYQIMKKEGMFN